MNRTYKIVASPGFMTVKTGDTVVFRLAPRNPLHADYSFDWEPDWYQIYDVETGRPGTNTLTRGPTAESWAVKFDVPGKYVIACVAWRAKPDRKWPTGDKLVKGSPAWDAWETCLYPQAVEEEEAFLFDPVLGKTTHALDPYSVLSGLKRYRATLYKVGKDQFPDPTVVSGTELYQEHEILLQTLAAEVEALERRLVSTPLHRMDGGNDRWERHPVIATHHLDDPESNSPDNELRLFLAKRIPEVAKIMGDPDKDDIEWKLVDWTNPVDRGRTGEYEGSGKTDYLAATDAVKIWANYYPLRIGNRYAKGTVSYSIPAGVCSRDEVAGSFLTDGTTWWDDVDEFLGWVGLFSLVVVGIVTLIAPVPGSQLASFAIWAGIAGAVAGAAQSAIHLAEQYQDDFARDWKEEAIDVLTIVGCLAGLGTSWARGAAVKGLGSLRAAKGIFYGSVGVDLLTGIIVADNYVEEMEKIRKDNSISPDKKIRKLMQLFAQLAGQSALVFVNIRANAKELAHFNKTQPQPPAGKPQAPADGPTGKPQAPAGEPELPPAERLKKYANPAEEIDVSKVPPLVGHTDEGQHTTIIRDDPYRPPIILKPLPPPPPPPPPRKLAEALADKKAWWTNEVTPTSINLDRRVPLSEKRRTKQPLVFTAGFENGEIHVDLVRTSITTDKRTGVRAPDFRADELYPWMFEHFEGSAKALGTPVKGIHGEFAWDNLRGVEEALLKDAKAAEIATQNPKFTQDQILEAMPQASVEAALQGAPSWKYWKNYADTHGYTMKAKTVAIRPEGHGGLVRHVEWSFSLEKKP